MTEKKSVRVAAVQMAPDLETADGTLSKVLAAIADAAAKGARLVVFPETFVPWYPYFSFVHPPVMTGAEHVRLPGPIHHEKTTPHRGAGCGSVHAPRRRRAPRGAGQQIFDTDIGNDVDDVLALSMLHGSDRGACEILGVTVTKPDELAGLFVHVLDTFYGGPGIPIGFIRPSPGEETSKFLPLANVTDGGGLRYPHKLKRGSDAPEPTRLLRRLLARQPDNSVGPGAGGLFLEFRGVA